MVKVREALKSDTDTIIKFQIAMALETENLQLKKEVVNLGVQAIFEDASKGKYFVATNEEVIVGSLLIIAEWSDWRNRYVWWIHSVYIDPGFRKQGIYKQMYLHLKYLVESCESLAGLRLYVDKRNQAAQKVYKKLGMDDSHYDLFEWLK